MSRLPESENLRNEIYENLPCHAMYNESVRKIKHNTEDAAAGAINNVLLNNCNQNSAKKPMLSKELLYATPLRKSDRYKSGERAGNKMKGTNDVIGGGTAVAAAVGIIKANEKLNNVEYKQINKDNCKPKSDSTTSAVAQGLRIFNNANNSGRLPQPSQDTYLEDRRILNFLKDTSQIQKKMDVVRKESANTSFSCLAREEHFANLVQQNFSTERSAADLSAVRTSNSRDGATNCMVGTVETVNPASVDCTAAAAGCLPQSEESKENLEVFMDKKHSPDKEVHGIANVPSTAAAAGGFYRRTTHIYINREWVLKKIALCLEQRMSTKKMAIAAPGTSKDESITKDAVRFLRAPGAANNIGGSSYRGCLVLGSNGSGKTSVCRSILNGNSGTKGILNRKLLGCYFLNSQNPDCHSLSLFIRSIVLQLLSHASVIGREEAIKFIDKGKNLNSVDEPSTSAAGCCVLNAQEEEELLIEQLKLSEQIDDFKDRKTSTYHKVLIRQKSAPCTENIIEIENTNEEFMDAKTSSGGGGYSTHPPASTKGPERPKAESFPDVEGSPDRQETNVGLQKVSPSKKSKIPIAISARGSPKNCSSHHQAIQQGGGEDIADIVEDDLKNEIEAEINAEQNERNQPTVENNLLSSASKQCSPECDQRMQKQSTLEKSIIPAPLPKTKSCRTMIADCYFEMLRNNHEIIESLSIDSIEKNPDECFRKALLFPLLELMPPRSAQLLLIDSIDENYIDEGNLISTLKGRCPVQKSRNIAELLSNHIHLFPKWLFLVCTAKKQRRHITKMFTGFKKINLDDLRKSHVVKDVQEYIINRLNSDFKSSVNLTKDIIESLHQLYIKSNGCILYLQKVLDGIKDGFFSFREIKLIPCTLNGLYLYICQKSFNKKQYTKIRPILNVLLASTGFVDKLFLFNCLRTHNYTIDANEFDKRLEIMRNILVYYGGDGNKIRIFHNSFADWLVDVKFATKKFACDVNEGHIMISMYYTLVSDTLCANTVRRFVYHLIKSGEYLNGKNVNLDLILMLLESRTNLNDCFYVDDLNCCQSCENEYKINPNLLPKTRDLIDKFLMNQLSSNFTALLFNFFKPSLPTNTKILKLLIETGINNASAQASRDSSLASPALSEKSQNLDVELADLLISSERSCQQETQRPRSSSDKSETRQLDNSQEENSSSLKQLTEAHRIEVHKGKALVHILASEGNHLLMERALNACKGPIDLEIEDLNGQTALNIASRNGHLEVVKLLLTYEQPINDGTGKNKTVDVNHADRDGWTPLRSASWGGHTEVVKLLIAHPGCSIDLADNEGRTALRAAAWSGHEDILKILIESRANVNSVDRQGRTSLIAASYMGHYDIVEILLENGADANHLDLDGRSALCVAALCGSSGYSKVISTLLEYGANTDQLDNDGMSPLLVSSFEGNGEVCELLLENGADPDLADFMGRTPLWAACTAGHAFVVKLLLFWGCGIDCMDSEGRTVLSIAAAQGNLESVRQLLDRGLDETHRDNAGWTPLHYSAFEGYHEVCMQLLDSGGKIDECDNEGKTALHLAAQEGRQRCVQVLLEVHRTFVDQKAHDGKTAFRLACLEGHLDCIQTLLKFGCDVNCKDADSRTTLYILALENKLDVVKYLLDVSDVDVNIPDSEGRTALHVAAWQGHGEMVKLLITLGNANVNAMDLDHRSPLHSCAWQGNFEVMEILLYFGAIPDHACKQGATALGISSQEGHEKCVAILLKYGANPYKSDHCGRTPIKLAAKSSRNSILKIFESYTKTTESNSEIKIHGIRSPESSVPDRLVLTLPLQNHPTANNNHIPSSVLNASNSTHSSNFYENTMQSDNSSLHKRKSVISSQSTASSNEVPLSFAQQLQRHTNLSSRRSSNPFFQQTPIIVSGSSSKHTKGQQKHAQMLPNLNEYQINLSTNLTANEADLFDMECMSPLYATPPHSPSSDLSSPGQLPPNTHHFEEIAGSGSGSGSATTKTASSTDHHFARDTHMRIILGNSKENAHQSSSKSKRSGIATNPAMRMIRSRFDSAAQLIRRTNNILNITSSSNSNQGSSSIGVKSSTFQWRKESQM